MRKLTSLLLFVLAVATARGAFALDAAAVAKLGFGDNEEKIEAISALVADADPRGVVILEALADGNLQTADKRVLIVKDGKAVDASTGATVSPVPEGADDITVNNRLRTAIQGAVAALRLSSEERSVRLASARELSGGADEAALPLVLTALDNEKDPEIRPLLEQVAALLQFKTGTPESKINAVRKLADSSAPNTRSILQSLLESEKDEDVRFEVEKALREIGGRAAWHQRAGLAFAGISLGSVLLLAALGLAITYGLMGVINMAHGELIMIGAYATYVVQNLFRAYLPGAFDWYLAAAVPISFCVAGAVGMVLERTVIRWLYGRPLETLLATWGISLMLIQGVRTLFGAQNVQVINPAFMSGGIEAFSEVVLPWNRIVIIAFAFAVLAAMWLLLSKTRLGLFVRGVTQNRAMAACVGIRTTRVDTWAFGLGSGIAGLAGCALSQIGNVGADLGQAYIVDSFMVVVFGGVGQLAGTVYASLILGVVNKLLESWSGAVLAKIAVLVFIVIFIQLRPQGMFALRGRAVEGT
jgi:urea transport system permease protein